VKSRVVLIRVVPPPSDDGRWDGVALALHVPK
jgi:hypothetical protein